MMAYSQSPDEYWLFGYGSLIWKPPPHYDCRIPGYIKGYVRRFWQARLDTIHSRCVAVPYIICLGQADKLSSEDHRGTPEAPGRVVTLIERSVWEKLNDHHEADDVVWGVAYRIEQSKIEETKEYNPVTNLYTCWGGVVLVVRVYDHNTVLYSRDSLLLMKHHTRYLNIREINGYSVHTVEVHQGDPTIPPIKTTVYIGTPENPQFIKEVPEVEDLAQQIFNSRGPSGENKEYLLHLNSAILELHPGLRDNHVAELSAIVKLLSEKENAKNLKSSEADMSTF